MCVSCNHTLILHSAHYLQHPTPPYIERYQKLANTANQNQYVTDDNPQKPHVVERHDLVELETVAELLLEEDSDLTGETPGTSQGARTLQDGDHGKHYDYGIQNNHPRARQNGIF